MRAEIRNRSIVVGVVALVLVAAAAIGAVAYVKFFRELPPPAFASDEEHFLFGSIGTEGEQGVPYWIWLVLPRIFPEYLPGPGGYASLGLLGKDGHEMPIGLSKVTIGYPRVGGNCALCHTGQFRRRPHDPPTIVAAAPSHQTGPQEYLRFLFASASDPRFTASTILGEIARNHRLSRLDRLLYRFVIIPRTRRALLRLADEGAWMTQRSDWGRGRTDAFNRVKFSLLGQPMDDTIGTADMTPVWNLKGSTGRAYHWDGLNTSLPEVVRSSALYAGATRRWVDRDVENWEKTEAGATSSLRRIHDYISGVQPPKYPFAIDAGLVTAGQSAFQNECASCHAVGAARTGTVVPATEVGTDRHRLETWTASAAEAYNAYGQGHAWKFSSFRTTTGYVAVPLDGLWMRAPFLHNGSVPSLADLLEARERRPTTFWRGYDVYDATKVGFVSTGAEAERVGTRFDTTRPGNSNSGHPYGTALPPETKRALLEYLKTL
jgi:mono/diheme cytochrome c family protein